MIPASSAPALSGVLFFPVTPFDPAGQLSTDLLAEHIESGVRSGAGAVFAVCGTGEFHALSSDEVVLGARTAVETTAGRVPVFAGAGGPLPVALDQVRRLAEAGVDGVLLLPPYLVRGTQAGIVDYVRQVAAATDLPVVVYHRGTAVLNPESAAEIAALPTVAGIKDGFGNLELMHRIVLAVRQTAGPDFQFFNGLPTAEMTVPAYRAVGVPLYSSAVFAFAPEIALAFYQAVEKGDDACRDRLLEQFYGPLVQLRDLQPGHPVGLVKAGVRLRGLEAGGVRAPFTDPTAEHVDRLAALIETGLEVVRR